VVTFDFPAHGESEGSHTNFIEFAVALKSVLEHSGPPVAVIGYSMGGGAAVSMWEKFDSNTRIVLISPLFDIFTTLSNLFEKIGFSPKLGDAIFKAVEHKYQISLSSINPAENARNVKGKVLVMNDEEDWIVTMEHAEELTRTMPGARLFRTTGLGHTRMLESEEVMTETLDFIRSGRK
jgi:pimeloyl-ACP methyl ester carboxylesterase